MSARRRSRRAQPRIRCAANALTDASIAAAAELAMSICDPAADQRGDAEYKTAHGRRNDAARAAHGALARQPLSRQRGGRRHGRRNTAVSFKLNGKAVDVVVEPRELLIHTLREKLLHTGPHIGCETSHCGACTVDLDGMSVKSCTVLTVQCQDAEVLTIEGFEQGGALHALQEGFTRAARPAMRLLHARHDHARLSAAQGKSQSVGRGDPLLDGRQPVPLHGLPEHRQGGAARGARNSRRRPPDHQRPHRRIRHGRLTRTHSSARPSCKGWALPGCARRTPASSAAGAPTSTTSSCPACCSARWCAAPTRMPASSRSTRPRRSRCRASSRC